jgi:hypothetical protein
MICQLEKTLKRRKALSLFPGDLAATDCLSRRPGKSCSKSGSPAPPFKSTVSRAQFDAWTSETMEKTGVRTTALQ